MDLLNNQELKKTASAFDNQTFTNWKLILPTEDEESAPRIDNEKVEVMKSGTNKVHNIERGVTRYCHHKGYAIILNKGENFNSTLAL